MSQEEATPPEEDRPPENLKNVLEGQNVLDDSFFDKNLEDISDLDDLTNFDFSTLGEETSPEQIQDVLESEIEISPDKIKNTSSSAKKENKMTKPEGQEAIQNLWDDMEANDGSDYKLMLYRLEPQTHKGMKISGYLSTYYLPIAIPDIIEKTGNLHGGGKYQIKAVDSNGRYIRAKTFEIAGIPKLPPPEEGVVTGNGNGNGNGPVLQQASTLVSNSTANTNSTSLNDEEEEDLDSLIASKKRRKQTEEDDEEFEEDDEDINDLDFEPSPRVRSPRFRPRETFNPLGGGLFGRPSEDISKVKEDLESKLDSKLERVTSLINNVASQIDSVRRNPVPGSSGLLTPELLHAAMPLAQAFLERNGSKDNILASQFDAMNQRIVTLFEGMRDMTRVSEKTREEILDKMEQRAQERQEKMEQRFQTLLSSMKEGLENRHSEMERAREEARLKEEKWREELRQQDEKWRSELRQREEEARKAEMRWREEMRQKEVQAERDSRKHELEILEKMRSMEMDKYKTEQSLLERSYQTDMGSKDQRINLQLELAKIAGENELKLLQLNSQMQLERMKHESQLQIAKMRSQLEGMSKKSPDEDPLDAVMTNFLKKKTQLMMIKELDAEGEYEDGTPSVKDALGSVIAQGTEALGPIIKQILSGGLNQQPNTQAATGRVVQGVSPKKPKAPVNNNNPPPPPSPEQQPKPEEPATKPPKSEEKQEPPKNAESKPAEPFEATSNDEDELEEQVEISPEALQEQIMNFFAGENPQEVIGRVASFFEYVKTSIEKNSATPEQAAQVAKDNLLPNLVEALKTVDSSREVIAEIQVVLVGLYGEEFASFFLKDEVVAWLDQMLESLRKL